MLTNVHEQKAQVNRGGRTGANIAERRRMWDESGIPTDARQFAATCHPDLCVPNSLEPVASGHR